MTQEYPLRRYIALVNFAVALVAGANAHAQQRETEPNDGFASADVIANVDTIFGRIATRGDDDYYRFEVPRSGVVRARVTDVSNDLGIDVAVYDSEQELLEQNTGAGSGRPAAVDAALCSSGVFYVLVDASTASQISDEEYRLVVTYDTVDVYECNPGLRSASAIALGDTIRATIRPDGDDDFYRFTVPRGGLLNARAFDIPTEYGVVVTFYDVDQEEIGNRQSGGAGEPVERAELICEPGDYYAEVRGTLNGRSSPTPYSFVVALDTVDRFECNNGFTEAAPLTTCDTVTVALQTPDDRDYFAFDAEAGDSLTVRGLEVPDADERTIIIFELYAPNQDEVARASQSTSGSPVVLPYRVDEAGEYFLVVRDGARRSSSPFRLLVEIPSGGCGASGLRDVEVRAATHVYPNPATETLNVELPSDVAPGAYRLDVRNLLGQVVLDQPAALVGEGPIQLDVSALPAGSYVASVWIGPGEVIVARFAVGL